MFVKGEFFGKISVKCEQKSNKRVIKGEQEVAGKKLKFSIPYF